MNAIRIRYYLLRATRDCQDPWHMYRPLDLLHTASGRVRKFRSLPAAIAAKADLDMKGCWEVVISAPDQRPTHNEQPPATLASLASAAV